MAGNVAPNIVTDGLVLYLDAANVKSYVSGSSTWTDLSQRLNNGVLVNDPTFSPTNSGNIIFNGTDNYLTFLNSSTFQFNTGTISSWFKTSNAGTGFRSIVAKQFNYGLFTSNNVLITYDWHASVVRTTGINIADNTWKHITLSFTDNSGVPLNNANIYLNGINVLTTTIKENTNFLVELEIGRGGTVPTGNTQYINGNISQTSIYNRALSSTEVLQNFNATRARFGI